MESCLGSRANLWHVHAGVAQWQSPSLPSWSCGFESRRPLFASLRILMGRAAQAHRCAVEPTAFQAVTALLELRLPQNVSPTTFWKRLLSIAG